MNIGEKEIVIGIGKLKTLKNERLKLGGTQRNGNEKNRKIYLQEKENLRLSGILRGTY